MFFSIYQIVGVKPFLIAVDKECGATLFGFLRSVGKTEKTRAIPLADTRLLLAEHIIGLPDVIEKKNIGFRF